MRSIRLVFRLVVLFASVQLILSPGRAFGQFVVDCTGNTPGAYTTINSVVPLLTNGSVVRITGPCAEHVMISGLNNLWIGAPWGQSAALQGNLTFNGTQNLYLYGMSVSGSGGHGIIINNSTGVTLDTCSSSNNGGGGLYFTDSTVTLPNGGTFNNNGNFGIWSTGSGDLSLGGSASPVIISNNVSGGISLQDGRMAVWGNAIISNNTSNPTSPTQPTGNADGYGVELQGHARAVFYVWNLPIGPNVISGNQAGGIAIHEGSELSLAGAAASGSGPWLTNVVDSNGPVGVYVGLGSQLTIWNGVQITNHADAGVDAYGQSEVFVDGNDQIMNNGSVAASTYPTRAGIRVDGNSEAYIRGGQFSQNGGPGVLALTNSSVDVSGATFISNSGGPVECDSSSWLVSDLPHGGPSAAQGCRVPNGFGPGFRAFSAPAKPDFSVANANAAKYRKLISSF